MGNSFVLFDVSIVISRCQFHKTQTLARIYSHSVWSVCLSLSEMWLLLGVEDTGLVTIEHCLANLLFFSLFFPFVSIVFPQGISRTECETASKFEKEMLKTGRHVLSNMQNVAISRKNYNIRLHRHYDRCRCRRR